MDSDPKWMVALYVLAGLLLWVGPVVACAVILLKRRNWPEDLPRWRMNLWRVGFGLTCFSAISLLALVTAVSLPNRPFKNAWLNAAICVTWAGLAASPLGLTLCGFGRGKARWFAMASDIASAIVLSITLYSLSF
jgi:hypothetical protein